MENDAPSQRTRQYYAVIFLGNTVLMLAVLGLWYAMFFAVISTTQKLLVIVPVIALAYGWIYMLKRMNYGPWRRSN